MGMDQRLYACRQRQGHCNRQELPVLRLPKNMVYAQAGIQMEKRGNLC